MPAAPRPPSIATKIALYILGRTKPDGSRTYGTDEHKQPKKPTSMKSKKFVSVGAQPIPHTFDGSLG